MGWEVSIRLYGFGFHHRLSLNGEGLGTQNV